MKQSTENFSVPRTNARALEFVPNLRAALVRWISSKNLGGSVDSPESFRGCDKPDEGTEGGRNGKVLGRADHWSDYHSSCRCRVSFDGTGARGRFRSSVSLRAVDCRDGT